MLLLHQDRAALFAGLQEARRLGDRPRLLASLLAMQQGEGVSPANAARLWSALTAVQGWEEALSLLEDRRFADRSRAGYWYDLACVRAAFCPLAGARSALQQALSLDPEHVGARALAEVVDRTAAYEARAKTPPNWTPLLDFVDLLIDLHRYRQAARVLNQFLTQMGARSSAKKLILALRRARILFRVLEPPLVLSLLLALRKAFAPQGFGEAFAWVCAQVTAPGEPNQPAPPEIGLPELRACFAEALAAHGKFKAAAVLHGPIATVKDDVFVARPDLARYVGRVTIDAVRPCFQPRAGPRKVVDVFPFYDELLLLKLKLEEMSPWVDHFVLLEARTTFTGKPKPLIYEQNKAAFEPWADKIVHQVVDFPAWAESPWTREFYQRDVALETVARLCAPDDLVLVSDVDEIIDRAAIEPFEGEFAALGMQVHNHFFNLRRTYRTQPTYGAVWRAKYLDRLGLSMARLALPAYSKGYVLYDAGWHFTSIKDAAGLLAKLQGYSHIENSSVDHEELADKLAAIRRSGAFEGHEVCAIDERMPRAVRDNLALISDYVL